MPLDKKDVDKSNRVASKTKFAVLRSDRSILLAAVFGLALINIYSVVK
ncbi:TPA: VirB8/TrbF family protein, partial [Escherichia coli]